MKAVKYQNVFSREVEEPPSWDMFKSCLNTVLANLS